MEPTLPNMGAILDRYLMACRAGQLSEKTLRAYADILRDFVLRAGVADPRALTADDIRAYVAQVSERRGLRGQFSTHSTGKYFAVVRTFLRWMYREGYIPKSITDNVKAPRLSNDLPDALDDGEQAALIALLRQRGVFRDFVIFMVFLDTGIRLAELAALDLPDLHSDELWMRIRGKGMKERFVPIEPCVSEAISRYVEGYRSAPPTEPALFVNRFGERLGKEGLSTLVRRVLPQIRRRGKHGPHVLRHTFATNFLRAGGDVNLLSCILGHSSIRMTQRYVHLQMVDIIGAHNQLSLMSKLLQKNAGKPPSAKLPVTETWTLLERFDRADMT